MEIDCPDSDDEETCEWGYPAFTYLDAQTGDLMADPIILDTCGGRIEHGAIATNEWGNKIYSLMSKRNLNVLT